MASSDDRLGRDAIDVLQTVKNLASHGVKVIVLQLGTTDLTGPAGKLLLSMLAAGPLEDVISMRTIDRIEREAAANKRFRDLLGGVWYFRAPEELKARLDALIGDARW